MAGRNIEFNISAQDQTGSINNLTNQARGLNTQLERAKKLSNEITGTQTGATAARQAGYRPTPQEDYTVAGGVSGRGMAASREFADQARGLGGLVRLYATWAANVFAVTAAFNGLREAMQTDMLIKGLDQLGASSGVALGGLAKQFAAISDGAISLRTAGEMTAKAMSSGMNPQQFMELGRVAKGAAQALGLNMEDAVGRLTRGIVKLEPELLDELGLFTKLDKAVADYARTVGKSESQLSDFERRQAFANAVVAEGQQKFKDISQEGNPFDRLLASMRNVSQDILSIINTVVAPVAKLLADNTGLITAGIVYMAMKITQQAIPALNSYKDYLAKSAKSARDYADVAQERFYANQVGKIEKSVGVPQSAAKVAVYQQELAELQKQEATLKGQGAPIAALVGASNRRLSKEMQISAELQRQDKLYEQVEDKLAKGQGVDIQGRMLGSILNQNRAAAARADINQQLAASFGELGVMGSFDLMRRDVNRYSDDLGRLGRIGAYVSGTFTIFGQVLAQTATWFSRFIPWIGGAVIAFELLDTLFSKNAKEVKAFESAVDGLEEAIKTATLTQEKYKGALTPESIAAVSNNFNGLTQNIRDLAKAFDEAEKASSWWDKIKDRLKGIVSSSRQDTAATNIGKSIEQAIKSTPVGPLQKELQDKLKATLGKVELTKDGISGALVKLDRETFSKTLKVLENILSDTDQVLNKSKTFTKNLEESSKKAATSYQSLANSVKDGSPLTVFLMDSIKRTEDLTLAFSDSLAAYSAMDSLVKGGTGTLMLGAEESTRINALTQEYDELNKQAQEYANSLAALQKLAEEQGPAKARYSGTTKDIQAASQDLETLKGKMVSIQQEVGGIVKNSFKNNVELLFQAYELRLQKTRIDAQKERLGLLSGPQTEADIRLRGGLERAGIATESKLAAINEELVLSQELARIAQDRNTDATLLDTKVRQASQSTNLRELEKLNSEITSLQDRLALYGKAGDFAQLARAGDLQGLKSRIGSENATMFASLIPLLQKTGERKAAEGEKIFTSKQREDIDVIGASFDRAINRAESAYSTLKSQLTDLSQFLSTGYRQRIDLYADDIKDRIELQKIDKDIAKNEYLVKQGGEIGKAAAARNQELKDRRETLVQQQGQTRAQKEANAELQIQKDLQKEMADQAANSIDNMIKLIDTTRSSGMIAVETLRQRSVAVRQEEADAIYRLETAKARSDLARYDLMIASNLVPTPEQAQGMEALRQGLAAADATRNRRKQIEGVTEATNQETAARQIALAQYDEQLAVTQAQLDLDNRLFQNRQTLMQNYINLDKQEVDNKKALNLLTQDEIDAETRRFERFRIEEDLKSKLRDIENERLSVLREYNREYNRQVTVGGGEEVDPTTLTNILSRIAGIKDAEESAKRGAGLQNQMLDNQARVNDRMRQYAGAWKGMFDGMANSMVDWMKTGKWTGKELLKDLLANIAAYELRLQLHAVYVQAIKAMTGAGGFWGTVAGLFTGGATTTTPPVMTAMGAVYDKGYMLHGYARGGIVNAPTTFGTGTGYGIMGEAGPEAIIPLRRNSRGELGVDGGGAGGSNTQVVVNNFSGERAETKETVDSRGNRKIEVVIGDAVNSNITRSGGTTQEAIKSTFGLRSNLIRR